MCNVISVEELGLTNAQVREVKEVLFSPMELIEELFDDLNESEQNRILSQLMEEAA